jgi:hypothetical protein
MFKVLKKNNRLFVNVWNRKIDVVLKASHAVVIRWFSLNEAPLGLFKFICVYLPYFEKINIFFNIIKKKVLIDRNYLFGSFEITSIRLYPPLSNPLWITPKVPHLKKITWWQWHATPWEQRIFSDSVHWKITSTF